MDARAQATVIVFNAPLGANQVDIRRLLTAQNLPVPVHLVMTDGMTPGATILDATRQHVVQRMPLGRLWHLTFAQSTQAARVCEALHGCELDGFIYAAQPYTADNANDANAQ